MAEQQTGYEFSAVDAREILADRQRGWDGFVRASTWAVGVLVVLLALMAFFLV